MLCKLKVLVHSIILVCQGCKGFCMIVVLHLVSRNFISVDFLLSLLYLCPSSRIKIPYVLIGLLL